MDRIWVLVSGKRYAGKDTVADALARVLGSDVTRASFAHAVKSDVAQQYGLSLERLLTDAAYKEHHRALLISHATDMRARDRSYWVRKAREGTRNPMTIVSDWRFPDEVDWFRSNEPRTMPFTVRVNASDETRCARGWVPGPVDVDPSECSLDGAAFDYEIDNNGSMAELEEAVRRLAATIPRV
jgi:phosphomevalonate kinase